MCVQRPFVWIILYFMIGISLYAGKNDMVFVMSICFVLVTTISFLHRKYYKFLIGLYGVLCLGFFLTQQSLSPTILLEEQKEVRNWVGMLHDFDWSNAGNQKMQIEIWLEEQEQTIEIYAIWTGEEIFSIGDILVIEGALLDFEPLRQKGGFDEALYYKSLGMEYKIFPKDIKKVDEVWNWNVAISQYKANLIERIQFFFPDREAGVIQAMLTGNSDNIEADLNELYIKSGINHIVCISGLHISFFLGIFSFLLGNIFKMSPRATAFFGIFYGMGFILFMGLAPSSMRAYGMNVVGLLGILIYRKKEWLNTIAFVGFVVLLIEPLYLYQVGFQLSFVTTFGIGVAVEAYGLSEAKTRKEKLIQFILVSFYASLFGYGIMAYHFYYISLIGLFMNMIVVPFVGVILFFAVLTLLVSLVSVVWANYFALIPVFVLQMIERVVTIGISIPNSYILVGHTSLFLVLLYYILLVSCTFYQEIPFCNKKTIGICMILMAFSIYGNPLFFQVNTIAFLDVGQGDATVITTYDKKAVIIDGGGIYGKELGENTGITVVKPYLEYMGIEVVEAMIITHFDRDHVLGIIELCEVVETKGVYSSVYPFHNLEYWYLLCDVLEKKEIPLYLVQAGDELQWERYGEMVCLSPPAGIYYTDYDDNHGSLVFEYTYAGVRTLLMGDATLTDEKVILHEGLVRDVDVLKVGHHGSRDSTSEAFLEAVTPEILLISCGRNNVYQHPHTELLERFTNIKTMEAEIFRTDEQGSIFLEINRKGQYEIEGISDKQTIYERLLEYMMME